MSSFLFLLSDWKTSGTVGRWKSVGLTDTLVLSEGEDIEHDFKWLLEYMKERIMEYDE